MEYVSAFYNKAVRFLERNEGIFLTAIFREIVGRTYSKAYLRKIIRPFFHQKRPKKWVFIIGCYNSGTTLLRELLGAHPLVSTLPREGVRFTNQFPDLQSGGWKRMLIKNRDKWGMPIDDVEERVDRIIKDWSPIWNPGAEVYLEKSIEHSVRISWLDSAFRSPYFITIIRDGFCVCEGIRRRASPEGHAKEEIGTDYPIELVAKQWVEINNEIKGQIVHVDHVYSLTYEQLVTDPVKVMKALFDYIGVPEPVISYKNHRLKIEKRIFKLRNMNPDSYKRLTKKEIDEARPVLIKEMKKNNYDIDISNEGQTDN